MLKARLVLLSLLATGLTACGQTQISPPVSPPASGPGWALQHVVMPSQAQQGVTIAPLGADQLLVSITVPAGGTRCGTPTFVGFDVSGSEMAARITRSPWDSSCAYTSAATYDVALDRSAIPPAVTGIVISDEWCHTPDDLCNSVPIPT